MGKATPKTYGSSIKTATLLLSGPRLTALSPIPPLPTVANMQTALTNVYNTYYKSIECGAVDPETIIPQMNSELYAAAWPQEYMDEKQRQLDEWASANGVS